MKFKDNTLSGILRSLAADEYLAWMQYYFGKVIAQGKALNHLDKLFDETGKDELDDHFNKLVTWMQSKDILVETDFAKMQDISNHPYFAFGDGTDSKTLIDAQIKAEQDAIDAYVQAMVEPEVVKYPDLVVILGEICADEREHLKELQDINSSVVAKNFSASEFDYKSFVKDLYKSKSDRLSIVTAQRDAAISNYESEIASLESDIDDLASLSNQEDFKLVGKIKINKVPNSFRDKLIYIGQVDPTGVGHLLLFNDNILLVEPKFMLNDFYVYTKDGSLDISELDELRKDFEPMSSVVSFSDRVNKLFALTKLPPPVSELKTGKISDFYEVTNGKIICDTKDEVREVVQKMNELDDWSVEVVCNFEDASDMFSKCWKFNDLSKLKLDTSKVTNMQGMFFYCNYLKSIPQLDTSDVTNMSYMFKSCFKLTTISQLNTSKVTDMEEMFCYCKSLTSISQLDTFKVINMRGIFYGCESLKSIPKLDTSKVTDMEEMFWNCTSLTSIPQLDTSKVTNMNGMFDGCDSLELIPKLNTSEVIDMGGMFSGCYSLATIPWLDTSKVIKMSGMFFKCHSLKSIPALDTSKVINMRGMFYECESLTSIPQLDTSKVADIRDMFARCDSLKRLGYPIDDEEMLKIISTTGIDGKPYKESVQFSSTELPTKEQFEAFERVRSEGKYNMFMEAMDAAKEARLSLKDYANVMNHYAELMDKYPEVRKVDFASKLEDDYDEYTFPSESGINEEAFYVVTKRNEKDKFKLYRRTFPDAEAANKFADKYESENKGSECRVLDGRKVAKLSKKFKDFSELTKLEFTQRVNNLFN